MGSAPRAASQCVRSATDTCRYGCLREGDSPESWALLSDACSLGHTSQELGAAMGLGPVCLSLSFSRFLSRSLCRESMPQALLHQSPEPQPMCVAVRCCSIVLQNSKAGTLCRSLATLRGLFKLCGKKAFLYAWVLVAACRQQCWLSHVKLTHSFHRNGLMQARTLTQISPWVRACLRTTCSHFHSQAFAKVSACVTGSSYVALSICFAAPAKASLGNGHCSDAQRNPP